MTYVASRNLKSRKATEIKEISPRFVLGDNQSLAKQPDSLSALNLKGLR